MTDGIEIHYSYKSVPTLRRFSEDNSFFRLVIGPYGSGKSTACGPIEIVNRAQAQNPSPDGIRRSRFMVVRNCYDDQTEILTEKRGWQLFRNLHLDDKVATLQRGTELVFEKPSYYYSAPYTGEMIELNDMGVNFSVTPDHKLYVSSRVQKNKVKSWGDYDFIKAKDCYGHKNLRRFKRDAVWQGQAELSENWFELLGLFFADGSVGVYPRKDCTSLGYRFTIAQKKYKEYTRKTLKDCGLSWHEYQPKTCPGLVKFQIHITDDLKPLIAELHSCGKLLTKKVPQWIKDAPAPHLKRFIHGFLMGDGHIQRHKHDVTRAATSSPFLANDLQELALRAGLVANVSPPRQYNRKPGAWNTNGPQYTVTFVTEAHYNPIPQNWSKVCYSGLVYCVEVSSHVVYVRRKGKAFWCSQTYRQLSDATQKTFFEWLKPHHFGEYKQTTNTFTIKALEGIECEILFRALDKPQDLSNLLSTELTGVWFNEMRDCPWPVIEAAQGRVGRYPAKKDGGATWSGVWGDSNPGDTDSKMYKYFVEEADHHPPGHAKLFQQPSGLLPHAENLANLPGGMEYYKRMAVGKDREWIKVYCEGQWGFVIDGRAVYPEYSDSAHCAEIKPLSYCEVIRGIDFGLTPACVFVQLSPNGQFLVLDELVADDMGIDRFSDEIISFSTQHYPDFQFIDVGDPAGQQRAQTDEKTAFQILQSKGIMVEGGMQSMAIRLESVRRPLTRLVMGKPAFQMHPRCKWLRKGFMGGYQYRRLQTSSERYTAVPDKNTYSHVHDALQYAATYFFGQGLTTPANKDPDQGFYDGGSDYARSEITGY